MPRRVNVLTMPALCDARIRRLLAALALLVGIVQAQPSLTPRILDLNALQGVPFPTMLRPSTAVIDPWRACVIVGSREYDHLAVFGPSGRQVGILPLPPGLAAGLRLLTINPVNGFIIAVTQEAGAQPLLRAFDPLLMTQAAVMSPGQADALECVPVAASNTLLLTTGRRHVLRLDGATLRVIDSLDVGQGALGMAVDTIRQEVSVVLDSPYPYCAVLSTSTWQLLRTYVIPLPDRVTRIAIDPQTQRRFLIGPTNVRVMDEFGGSYYSVPVPGRTMAAAVSPRTHRLLLLDSAGYGPSERREGKLFSFDASQKNWDSIRVGMDCRQLVINGPDDVLVLISTATAGVEFRDIPSGSILGAASTGHSVEDCLLQSGGRMLFVTNAFGSARDISVVDLRTSVFHRISTGARPVRLIDAEGRIIVQHHFGRELVVLDASEGLVIDTVRHPDGRGGATDVLPQGCRLSDGHLLLYPEEQTFVVTRGERLDITRTDRIPGFVFPGDVETPPLECGTGGRSDAFVILDAVRRRLLAYPSIASAVPFERDLSALNWSLIPDRSGPRMTTLGTDRIMLGPYMLDPFTNEPVQRLFDRPALMIGRIAPADLPAWIEWRDTALVLLCSLSATPSVPPVTVQRILDQAPRHPSVVRMDSDRRRLLLGDAHHGRVFVYDLSGIVGVDAPAPPRDDALHVHPNPLPAGNAMVVDLPEALRGDRVVATLHDTQGRRQMTVMIDEMHSAARSVVVQPAAHLRGVFLVRLVGTRSGWSATTRVVLRGSPSR